MSAFEIIELIKQLPACEQLRIAHFIAANNKLPAPQSLSVVAGTDGLPVIRGSGPVITSELVRELESMIP